MSRRKKASPMEDLVDLVSMFPWWVGTALAPIAYIVMHAWAVRAAAEITTHPTMLSGVYVGVASIGKYVLPLMCLAGSTLSAWRRHTRKGLADHVTAASFADAIQEISWREFEMLVGAGFGRRGFRVEELGLMSALGWLVDLPAFAPRADHLSHIVASAIVPNLPSHGVAKRPAKPER